MSDIEIGKEYFLNSGERTKIFGVIKDKDQLSYMGKRNGLGMEVKPEDIIAEVV